MIIKTLPIISKKFISSVGKTAIECNDNGTKLTVWVNGDKEGDASILCNVVVNEVGDTFTATKDSKTMKADGTPIYLKDEVVTRQAQSTEFKSFATNGSSASHFVQAAAAYGINLQVVLGAS
jgi:hypothetical protein